MHHKSKLIKYVYSAYYLFDITACYHPYKSHFFQVFGDPHFVSFDGAIFNLPGASCDYVMALDQDAGTWFIYGRMRPCGSLAQGVCLESVTIYAGGDAIELQRGWVVNHKGKKIETRERKKEI